MKYQKQLKAKELRAQGKSVNYIAKELDVSKSSVVFWTQDVILTTEQLNNLKQNRRGGSIQASIINRTKHLNQRKEYQEEGRSKAREENLLHCMGCMLFWAEGSKIKNQITFTNSDVNMMKLFVRFLIESLGVSASDISMRINCFLNNENEIDGVHDYWIDQLNIKGCSIQKPTIKITNLPVDNFGVCCINVFDTKLTQQLYGAIQEYGGFNNGMCLNNKRSRKINH
jgi:hypothetical protein